MTFGISNTWNKLLVKAGRRKKKVHVLEKKFMIKLNKLKQMIKLFLSRFSSNTNN